MIVTDRETETGAGVEFNVEPFAVPYWLEVTPTYSTQDLLNALFLLPQTSLDSGREQFENNNLVETVSWNGCTISLQVFRGDCATPEQIAHIQALRHSYNLWGDFDQQLEHITQRESDTADSNRHVILDIIWPDGNHYTYCLTAEFLDFSNGKRYDELDLWRYFSHEEQIAIRKLLQKKYYQESKTQTSFAHLTRLATTNSIIAPDKQTVKFQKATSIILTFYLSLFFCRADFYLSQNPSELRSVFSAQSSSGDIGLSFPDFKDTFNLDGKTQLAITAESSDSAAETIKEYAFYWPGYWFSQAFFVQHIRTFYQDGLLTDADIALVYEKAGLKTNNDSYQRLDELLKKQGYYKYFTHLFLIKREIFARLFDAAVDNPHTSLQPILCAYSQEQFLEEIAHMVAIWGREYERRSQE